MRERRAVFRLDGDFFSPVNERFSGEGARFSGAGVRERKREKEREKNFMNISGNVGMLVMVAW